MPSAISKRWTIDASVGHNRGLTMGKTRRRPATTATVDTLGELKKTLLAQQRAMAEQLARERAAFEAANREALAQDREQALEQRLLDEAFGDVLPLKHAERVHAPRAQPAPLPRQRERDEQAALVASLSDDIDLDRYLDTDEALSYSAPGVGPEVVVRLRRGAWRITAQLDLHGLRRDEARDVLVQFLDDCRRNGNRCVRIIHGKGLGSVNREPVLKDKVRKWLVQRADVLAFCQAPPNDGGGGAVLVLLTGSR